MKYNVKVTITASYQVDDTDYDIDEPTDVRRFIEEEETRGISEDISVIAEDITSMGVSVWKADE